MSLLDLKIVGNYNKTKINYLPAFKWGEEGYDLNAGVVTASYVIPQSTVDLQIDLETVDNFKLLLITDPSGSEDLTIKVSADSVAFPLNSSMVLSEAITRLDVTNTNVTSDRVIYLAWVTL